MDHIEPKTMDHIEPKTMEHIEPTADAKLRGVLCLLGLEHSTRVFMTQEITLHVLSKLNEEELSDIGISTRGARRRIVRYFSSCEGVSVFGPRAFYRSA
jgi:uncharacterized protein YjiS (DUF1127 family)